MTISNGFTNVHNGTGQEQLDVLYHQAVPNLLLTTVEEDNVVCVMGNRTGKA